MALRDITRTGLALGLGLQMVLAVQWSTVAEAEMIGTDAAIAKYATGGMDRSTLMDELRKEDVRAEMIALGVDPAEAEARLAALSDAEVAAALAQTDAEEAGASGVVGALFTIFVILLVTDILCFTRVFNFTRCVR